MLISGPPGYVKERSPVAEGSAVYKQQGTPGLLQTRHTEPRSRCMLCVLSAKTINRWSLCLLAACLIFSLEKASLSLCYMQDLRAE